MRELRDYHHFRHELIAADDRVARCERHVVDLLLTGLGDAERESSVAFELKHHHSVAQFGRVLARKRGLDVDLATVGCLLHDIHVVVHGTYRDHAHLGAPLARGILVETGSYSLSELDVVNRLIYNHSDKHVVSTDAWEEFGKDADVLDCFLYPNAFEYYLRHKTLDVFRHYLERASRVWREIGMPHDERFDLLRGFTKPWLGTTICVDRREAPIVVARLLSRSDSAQVATPPFLLQSAGSQVRLCCDGEVWATHFGREAAQVVETAASSDAPIGWNAAEAPTVGALIDRCVTSGESAMFWPVLDGYEFMHAEHQRWSELAAQPQQPT